MALIREDTYKKISALFTYCGQYLSAIKVKNKDSYNTALKKINDAVESFTLYNITIEFLLGILSEDVYADYEDLMITGVTNILGNPITTILVNNNPYTFGTPMNLGDKISVLVDGPGVIRLNISKYV